MRRLGIVVCVAAVLLGACSSKSAVTTGSPSPSVSAAPTEPPTAEVLKLVAQRHFNSFAVGDFDSFWDDFDAASKSFISKDEYVKRLTACMQHDPNKNAPFRVTKATDNKDGTWTVETRYTKYLVKFPARYETGHWRFGLAPDARSALKLPFDQYLATKCVK